MLNISAVDSLCLYFIIAVERVYIAFRLTNSVMVSRDRFVTGARERVVSLALYKCLNNNLF